MKQKKISKSNIVVFVLICVLFCGCFADVFASNVVTPSAIQVNPSSKLSEITFNGEGYTNITLDATYGSTTVNNVPVYCITKGSSPDNNHYALFFVGDGYTKDEQPKFIEDVKNKTALFLNTAPYSFFKDQFDVYAIEVPSNESGKNADTFFGVKNSLTIGAKSTVFQQFRNPLADALSIDKDKDVYQCTLISNHPWGVGTSASGGRYSVIGREADAVFIHESGHAANGLTDEYYAGPKVHNNSTKANRLHISTIAKDGVDLEKITMYDYDDIDVSKAQWSEYLGYRECYIDAFDDTGTSDKDPYGRPDSALELRPNHKQSMMGNAGAPYCPVCEAEIFSQLNKYFGYPYDTFVPALEFSYPLVDIPTYYCNWPSSSKYYDSTKAYHPAPPTGKDPIGQPPKEFRTFTNLSTLNTNTNTDLLDASNHDITLRTVICSYNTPTTLTLKLTVLDENNTIVGEKTKDYPIGSNKIYTNSTKYASSVAASMELTLAQSEWKTITGSDSPDLSKYKIIGQVLDENGNILQKTDDISTPSPIPTHKPTSVPTTNPTHKPTSDPTANPTHKPTSVPTVNPTHKPTSIPTVAPTEPPNPTPPTIAPTNKPTSTPNHSYNPSPNYPTVSTTPDPTIAPTVSPTITPVPTKTPTASPKPTKKPSKPRPTKTPSSSSSSDNSNKRTWNIKVYAYQIVAEKKKGYVYSLNGKKWSNDSKFTNLTPFKTYTLYVKNSVTKEIIKTSFITFPSHTSTETSVSIGKVAGYEYKIDNGKWTKTPNFKNLQPGKKYQISARKYAVNGKKADKVYKNTVKTKSIIKKVTSSTIKVVDRYGWQYKINGGKWQKNNTFKNLKSKTTYTIYMKKGKQQMKQKVKTK